MSKNLNKKENNKNSDSHIKSILKGISWRIVATSTTILVAYLITGEIQTALGIGAVEFLLKVFIYYVHERAWIAVDDINFNKLLPDFKKYMQKGTDYQVY